MEKVFEIYIRTTPEQLWSAITDPAIRAKSHFGAGVESDWSPGSPYTMVIFINQIRMKIGVMFGSPETTTGGNALKFYASVRLDIRRIGSIKKGEEVIGNETKVKVVKNKVAPPFKTAEFDILYGAGISREGEIIDMGVEARVLEKSGAWYAYQGEKIGQGKDNAREFLRENKALAVEIENKVREAVGIPLIATGDVKAPAAGKVAKD